MTCATIVVRSCRVLYVCEHTSKILCDEVFVVLNLTREAQRNELWNLLRCLVLSAEPSCQKMIRHLLTWLHIFAHSSHMVIWFGDRLILHVCQARCLCVRCCSLNTCMIDSRRVDSRALDKDLESRSTDRSDRDCAALAQWMAETARSVCANHRDSSGPASLRGVRGV